VTARAPGFLAWMSRDAALIALARGMRTFGQGAVVVLLAIYLDVLGFSVIQIGLFISAGLAGGALFTLVVVVAADAFGRRRLLVLFSLMTSAAALTVVATESFSVLLLASFVGSFAVARPAARWRLWSRRAWRAPSPRSDEPTSTPSTASWAPAPPPWARWPPPCLPSTRLPSA
jgi:MFS family permease